MHTNKLDDVWSIEIQYQTDWYHESIRLTRCHHIGLHRTGATTTVAGPPEELFVDIRAIKIGQNATHTGRRSTGKQEISWTDVAVENTPHSKPLVC